MIDLLVKIDVHLRRPAKFLSRPEKQTAAKVEQPDQQSITLTIHKFPGQELKYANECTFISLLRAHNGYYVCLQTIWVCLIVANIYPTNFSVMPKKLVSV